MIQLLMGESETLTRITDRRSLPGVLQNPQAVTNHGQVCSLPCELSAECRGCHRGQEVQGLEQELEGASLRFS